MPGVRNENSAFSVPSREIASYKVYGGSTCGVFLVINQFFSISLRNSWNCASESVVKRFSKSQRRSLQVPACSPRSIFRNTDGPSNRNEATTRPSIFIGKERG